MDNIKTIMRERLFIDMTIDRIKDIDEQLSVYSSYMTDEEYNNSKEVNEMYLELKGLIK